MTSHCRIKSITDFGDLPVFQAATAYPMIFCAQRAEVAKAYSSIHTRVPSLESPYPEVTQIVKQFGSPLQSSDLDGTEWNLGGSSYSASGNATSDGFKPLLAYAGGQVLYGVKTGMNEAFVIDAETKRSLCREDRRSSEFIKPLVTGKDIRRWDIREADRFLLYTPHGCVPPKSIKDCIRPFKAELKNALQSRNGTNFSSRRRSTHVASRYQRSYTRSLQRNLVSLLTEQGHLSMTRPTRSLLTTFTSSAF